MTIDWKFNKKIYKIMSNNNDEMEQEEEKEEESTENEIYSQNYNLLKKPIPGVPPIFFNIFNWWKSLGNFIVYKCYGLKKIIIPDVQNIEKLYLQDLSCLTEFNIPSTVTRIYEKAFINCESLRKIVIPSSVTFIEQYAFSRCSSLKEVTIPPSVKSIEDYTFEDCTSLKTVKIPQSVTSIGFKSFYRCKSLEYITLPSSVKKIGFDAFLECSSLKRISIPSSLEKIPQNIEIVTQLHESYRILLLGASNVGKTSILKRFVENELYNGPTTVNVYRAFKTVNVQGFNIQLQILDTAGAEMFHSLIRAYYHNMDGAVVVFDLTDPQSLDSAKKFFEEIYEVVESVPSVLIGNKSDLDHEFSDTEIKMIENNFNIKYFEVSAISNSNIDEAFQYLASIFVNDLLSDKNKLLNLINKDEIEQNEKKCNIY